jgi:hypothetical protein
LQNITVLICDYAEQNKGKSRSLLKEKTSDGIQEEKAKGNLRLLGTKPGEKLKDREETL